MVKSMSIALIALLLFINALNAQYCTHRKDYGATGGNLRPLYRVLSEELVNYVNFGMTSSWTAQNSQRFTTLSQIKRVLGVTPDPNRLRLPKLCKMLSQEEIDKIPETFDAREKWNSCEGIGKIKDDGECGSSWASTTVDAITDRLCIHKDQRPVLSHIDIVSCCGPLCGSGCDGGIPAAAWDYWVYYGLVTSGKEGCKPCPFSSCSNLEDSDKRRCEGDRVAPNCEAKCSDNYPRKYDEEKKDYRGQRVYSMNGNMTEIMHEIMTNGPVQTDFEVYSDFIHYSGGIYEHNAGSQLGYHSVKIIGWGVSNDIPYWLATNSWGPNWGENGFFRIRRGQNVAGFETDVNAGMPVM